MTVGFVRISGKNDTEATAGECAYITNAPIKAKFAA
jgi:hypothetical protein